MGKYYGVVEVSGWNYLTDAFDTFEEADKALDKLDTCLTELGLYIVDGYDITTTPEDYS